MLLHISIANYVGRGIVSFFQSIGSFFYQIGSDQSQNSLEKKIQKYLRDMRIFSPIQVGDKLSILGKSTWVNFKNENCQGLRRMVAKIVPYWDTNGESVSKKMLEWANNLEKITKEGNFHKKEVYRNIFNGALSGIKNLAQTYCIQGKRDISDNYDKAASKLQNLIDEGENIVKEDLAAIQENLSRSQAQVKDLKKQLAEEQEKGQKTEKRLMKKNKEMEQKELEAKKKDKRQRRQYKLLQSVPKDSILRKFFYQVTGAA